VNVQKALLLPSDIIAVSVACGFIRTGQLELCGKVQTTQSFNSNSRL